MVNYFSLFFFEINFGNKKIDVFFFYHFHRSAESVPVHHHGVQEWTTDPSAHWRRTPSWKCSWTTPCGQPHRMVPSDVHHPRTSPGQRGSTSRDSPWMGHLDWVNFLDFFSNFNVMKNFNIVFLCLQRIAAENLQRRTSSRSSCPSHRA